MEPMDRAKAIVGGYFNSRAEITDHTLLNTDDIYVVWFCYILGGWKALISTTIVDGMYYEVTYDKAMGATYLDVYKKWDNKAYGEGD